MSRSLRSFGELVVIVAVALFFAFAIQAYAVKPYVIRRRTSSGSWACRATGSPSVTAT